MKIFVNDIKIIITFVYVKQTKNRNYERVARFN